MNLTPSEFESGWPEEGGLVMTSRVRHPTISPSRVPNGHGITKRQLLIAMGLAGAAFAARSVLAGVSNPVQGSIGDSPSFKAAEGIPEGKGRLQANLHSNVAPEFGMVQVYVHLGNALPLNSNEQPNAYILENGSAVVFSVNPNSSTVASVDLPLGTYLYTGTSSYASSDTGTSLPGDRNVGEGTFEIVEGEITQLDANFSSR